MVLKVCSEEPGGGSLFLATRLREARHSTHASAISLYRLHVDNILHILG